MLVYGCGKIYQEKEESILLRYKIDFIIDNFKKGIYKTKNDDSIKIISFKDLNKVEDSIIIMREHFVDVWRELRGRGIRSDIHFPYEFKPQSFLEQKLFSHGEFLCEKEQHLYYVDSKRKFTCIDECNGIREIGFLIERQNCNASSLINLPVQPYNREFGYSRGTPIDRYYLEGWLDKKREFIAGDVLEIAENTYTFKYGAENLKKSYMLHVEKDEQPYIKGNFETGEGIEDGMVDCIILTQTLPCIYDVNAAMKNIAKILRPNGYLLLSVAGMEQISRYDMDRWGDYWRFTDLSLKRLINDTGQFSILELEVFGNVKSVCCLFYGIAAEELEQSELDYKDRDYPMIMCALCQKR